MPRAKHPAAAPGDHDEHDEGAPAAGEEPNEKGQMQSAPTSEKPAAVTAVFESEHASLIVYRKGKKIAMFVGGRFATSDLGAIEALRGSELVREVGGSD